MMEDTAAFPPGCEEPSEPAESSDLLPAVSQGGLRGSRKSPTQSPLVLLKS